MAKGKGGGGKGGINMHVMYLIGQVIGVAFFIFAMILFGIGIDQLDTAYTAAGTYTEQVGLQDIMGIWGMILFLVFTGAGITVIAGTAVLNFMKTIRGTWMDAFMSFAMASVALVVSLILNTLAQSQLHAAYVTANATTNIAAFAGLLSIMGVFGMLVFLTLMGSGISGIVASGWGIVNNVKKGGLF